MTKPLPWPWHWDERPHGWRGDTFGPLPANYRKTGPVRASERTPEEQAAWALLHKAKSEEGKRRAHLIKAVGVK